MEATNQDPVGTEETKPVSDKPQKDQDTVAYDTYRKVLSEKKARDERLREMEERLQSFEQTELERKGQHEAIIKTLRDENQKLKSDLSTRDRAYVMSKVNAAITTKAVEAGCKAPDKLLRLIDREKIEALEIDDNYNVNSQAVEYLINEAKKENDFLFKRNSVNVQDGTPLEKPVEKPGKQIKDMTNKEIEELYRQTYNKR